MMSLRHFLLWTEPFLPAQHLPHLCIAPPLGKHLSLDNTSPMESTTPWTSPPPGQHLSPGQHLPPGQHHTQMFKTDVNVVLDHTV